MEQYFNTVVATKDANDLFVRIGWCPEKVKLTNITEGKGLEWTRIMGNDTSLERVAAGDLTTNTDKGIKLVKFVGTVADQRTAATDPTAVDPSEWYDADGIQITADVAFLADDVLVLVEAWRSTGPRIIKCTHDGATNNNTYCEDLSFDFKKIGVKPGDIIYNQTNANYAFVKSLGMGSTGKWSRIYTSTDRAGQNATTAADFDTSDVFFVIPAENEWYPITDLTEMT